MRLVDKEEFLTLPGHTFYSLYDAETGKMEEMILKDGGLLPPDWSLMPFTNNYKELDSSEVERLKAEVEREKLGKYQFKELQEGEREYADTQLFAIMEQVDIELLILKMKRILEVGYLVRFETTM